MYLDLNIPIPNLDLTGQSKKGKAPVKQAQSFSLAQIAAVESRVELLIHCQ
jgi:hypothetical protein